MAQSKKFPEHLIMTQSLNDVPLCPLLPYATLCPLLWSRWPQGRELILPWSLCSSCFLPLLVMLFPRVFAKVTPFQQLYLSSALTSWKGLPLSLLLNEDSPLPSPPTSHRSLSRHSVLLLILQLLFGIIFFTCLYLWLLESMLIFMKTVGAHLCPEARIAPLAW